MGNTGIIGGGASGMMAAIAAARAGEHVTILERRDRVGKKILATGNGRCNLSNRDFCVERDFRSASGTAQISRYFVQFGVEDTLSFFEKAGLITVEKGGYLYPRSLQAAAVLDLLRSELECLGVEMICSCKVTKIEKKHKFVVSTDQGEFFFDRLILACGSAAGTSPKEALGGFELAKRLGLSIEEPVPALTALRCRERFFKSLAGIRCAAGVTLQIYRKRETGGQPGPRGKKAEMPEASYMEEGELQLTDYGISGIPVFQCSRYAAAALARGKRVEAILNFMPEYGEKEWQDFCKRQYHSCLGKSVMVLGSGILHKKLVQLLLGCCDLKQDDVVEERTRERIFSMFALMRSFPVEVISANPMESAQVCAGGVALSEVDEDLQVKRIPGLYLCGEMLDVDGRCGGYNLQWAWSSGHIAGSAAAGIRAVGNGKAGKLRRPETRTAHRPLRAQDIRQRKDSR